MSKRKSGGANGKPPKDESPGKPPAATPLPVPHAPAEAMPILYNLKPGPAAAKEVYRAAHTYALRKARDIAESEDEANRLLPVILATIMVELNVPALAAAVAQAKDPNIYMLQLRHEVAVSKYQRLMGSR
jgi:hypothetical protein